MSEEPEPEGGSRAAGGCLLAGLVTGAVAVLLIVAPRAGVLILWGVGAVLLWWAVNRPNKLDTPSPPPPEAPSENTKRQFRSVPDPDNDHHTFVVWDTEKEN